MIDSHVEYEVGSKPTPEELLRFYERHNHRTTQSLEKLQRMIDHTFCFVTARRDGEIIGLARGVTDGVWGRLVECKLDPLYQGPACVTRSYGRIEHDASGIAQEMATRIIDALRDFGCEHVDALAYGTEVDFCEELGFKRVKGSVALELDLANQPAMAAAGGAMR